MNTTDYVRQKRFVFIIIGIGLFILLIANTLGWIYLQRIKTYFISDIRFRLENIANISAKLIDAADLTYIIPENESDPQVIYYQNLLYDIKSDNNLQDIYILDPTLQMLVDVSPRIQADITRPMPDEDLVQNALRGRTSTGSLKTLGDHKFLTAVTPLIDTDNHITGLLVVEVEAEFFDVLDQFDQGLLIFSILNIILILSVAFYLFRSISRVFFLQNQIKNQEHLVKLGEMAASVAHELRNPLGIMKGANSLIQKKYGSVKDEIFTYIPTELDRLNKIIEDFLIFARTRELNLQSVDLKNLLTKICVGYMNLRNIKISIDIPDDFPTINTDPDALEQIFLNVLTNSIQALSGKGEINIKCEIRKKYCQIYISDNGNGITAENIDQIFEPFFTTKEEGSGLGLSISKRLIDQLNGTIHITSEPTGGTDVLIELPRQQKADK